MQDKADLMTTEEAILRLREDPAFAEVIHDSYLEKDVHESANRFVSSGEFAEVRKLLDGRLQGATLLDLGAGNGIGSFAFSMSGARRVVALEPSPSDEIGRGAIRRLPTGLPIEVIDGSGEAIPLPDAQFDIVYARQVLHHTQDLPRAVCECARVLKSGGIFFACREHVVDNEQQLRAFLEAHPVHRLAGGENAYRLEQYLAAIHSAGLKLERVLGPWDSVINAFPAVLSSQELERYPEIAMRRHLGSLGSALSALPGMKFLLWMWRKRPFPGRLYSFLASKP